MMMNPEITELNANMHIVLIYLGRRGAGGWISYELAARLQDKFPTVMVTSQYVEHKINWASLQTERIVTPTFRSAISALVSLLVPIRIHLLVQEIRRRKPDVLLFPMFHPWNAIIQKRMSDIPSVVFVHDPDPHPDLAGWFYGTLEQASIRRARRCVILSENLVGGLLKRGAVLEDIDIIPLGPFRLTPGKNLFPKKEGNPTLLFFGRIAPYKGLDVLLRAYADVRKTHSARLLISGEGNIEPFRHLLEHIPDVDIINHWIPESEIGGLFQQGDILVLPYTSASQSGVIPIAASFGMPVIATHTGGIPEQIEDGVSGWLVPPGNVTALVGAIKDVIDHPEMARQRGAALKTRYESNFNWDEIGVRVGESLRKAMQAGGRV
jgi:glycosyltransferase involved in cell wall biosynthesis